MTQQTEKITQELTWREQIVCGLMGRLKTNDGDDFRIPVCLRNRILVNLSLWIHPRAIVFIHQALRDMFSREELSEEDLMTFCKSLTDNI